MSSPLLHLPSRLLFDTQPSQWAKTTPSPHTQPPSSNLKTKKAASDLVSKSAVYRAVSDRKTKGHLDAPKRSTGRPRAIPDGVMTYVLSLLEMILSLYIDELIRMIERHHQLRASKSSLQWELAHLPLIVADQLKTPKQDNTTTNSYSTRRPMLSRRRQGISGL